MSRKSGLFDGVEFFIYFKLYFPSYFRFLKMGFKYKNISLKRY